MDDFAALCAIALGAAASSALLFSPGSPSSLGTLAPFSDFAAEVQRLTSESIPPYEVMCDFSLDPELLPVQGEMLVGPENAATGWIPPSTSSLYER